jgi:outer membrane protein assembly factor BamB
MAYTIGLVAGIAAMAACSPTAGPPEQAPGTTAGTDGPSTMRIQAVIELPGTEAYGLATGTDAMWAIAYQAGALSKVDPDSDAVVSNIPMAAAASVLALDDTVWVAGYGGPDSRVYRVDARSGRVVATIETGEICCDLTADDASIWALDPAGSLIRIDRSRNEVVQRIPVAIDRNAHTNAVYAGGSLWVSSDTTKLFRIDTGSGATTELDVGGGVPFLADHGLVWGASPTRLWALDEQTGALAREVPLADSTEVLSLGLGFGSIWIGIRHPGRVGAVLRIDEQSGAELDEITDIDIPARIAIGFGSVWITDSGGSALYRVSPDP